MRLFKSLRRFGRARKGLAALEFAILLPVMVGVLLAAVDLIDALEVYRRAENTSSSLADVVSRDTSVSDSEITGLWSAVGLLMYPNASTNMSEVLTSINVTSTTQAVVVWSKANNGASPHSVNTTVTLPSQMMVAGTSLIMAETTYQYSSPLHVLFPSPITFTNTAYRRSRLVDPIPCSWSGC